MDSKICRVCEIKKHFIFFSQAKGNRDNISNRCKDCDTVYQQEYRKANGEEIVHRSRMKRVSRKLQAIDRFGSKCSTCGLSYHPSCYDFHHLDPSKKEFTIGENLLVSQENFTAELDKCIMLCANCHREAHAKDEWNG
jgi:hypothetical protein